LGIPGGRGHQSPGGKKCVEGNGLENRTVGKRTYLLDRTTKGSRKKLLGIDQKRQVDIKEPQDSGVVNEWAKKKMSREEGWSSMTK